MHLSSFEGNSLSRQTRWLKLAPQRWSPLKLNKWWKNDTSWLRRKSVIWSLAFWTSVLSAAHRPPIPTAPRPMTPNDLLYIITSRWISISNSHPTNYPSLFSSNRSKSLALKLYPLRTSQRIFTHCCTTEFRSHDESFTLLFVPHNKDSRPDQSETNRSIEKHNLRILLLCYRFYTVEKEVSLWHCLRKIASDEY